MTTENLATENDSPDAEDETSALGSQTTDDSEPSQAEQNTVATPEDYAVEIEGFDFDEFKGIEENQTFLKAAHAKGMSNEQLNFILGEYNRIAPELVQNAVQLDAKQTTAQLREEWGDETDTNLSAAYQAAVAAGFSNEQINDPSFGNNPAVIKLAAHFGKQLGEDQPPKHTQSASNDSVDQLMKSEAYLDAKHPDHQKIYAQVEKHYASNFK